LTITPETAYIDIRSSETAVSARLPIRNASQRSGGMMPVRIGLIILTSCIIFVAIVSSGKVYASDLSVRKAATPTGPAHLGAYNNSNVHESQQNGLRSPIGISPMPFRPEPSTVAVEHRGEENSQKFFAYPDIRNLVKKVNPSVVSIRMLEAGSQWSLGNMSFNSEPQGKAMGYGSGFIVSRNGLIITNEHVLRNGTRIEVELLNGKKYDARMLYKDTKNDLALIKIEVEGLPPVKMGNSDGVELGEWVIGIGNPYGIGQSVMVGIVSAQKRTIQGAGYPPLIQIDAAMNLGNSGGPLFNMEGEVVGINTILLWKSQGIGFATPINVAKDFLIRNKLVLEPVKPVMTAMDGPMGPVSDQPRAMSEPFNPLEPPWKFKR